MNVELRIGILLFSIISLILYNSTSNLLLTAILTTLLYSYLIVRYLNYNNVIKMDIDDSQVKIKYSKMIFWVGELTFSKNEITLKKVKLFNIYNLPEDVIEIHLHEKILKPIIRITRDIWSEFDINLLLNEFINRE